MSDRNFVSNKASVSNFSSSSLVSPATPTLTNPTRGFGLTNNFIQTQSESSAKEQELASVDEVSLEQQIIQEKPLGHDISRISFHRPQSKLTVGKPGDRYEQEADSMANRVMRMVLPGKLNTPTINPVQNSLQRKCAACQEEEDKIQTKSISHRSLEVENNLETRLYRSKGGGSPLPEEVRSFMEPRFGADFSQVRVHTDTTAVQMNRELSAQAFTHGSDVYFGEGKSPGNNELTAHELTHVIQQTGSLRRKQVSPQNTIQLKCSACEKEANEELSKLSQPKIQRWSLFDDEENQQEQSDNSSSGGILDWAKEKGGEVVDTVTQAGGDAVDWAKEKGGEVVDTVTQAGGDAVDWAKEKGKEFSSDLFEQKKSSLLAQISQAMQQVAGQDFVYLTDTQINTLNGHLATLSQKSQGSITISGLAAENDAQDSTAPDGTKPVAASTVTALLQNLESSLSTPFMSPSDAYTSDSDNSGMVQEKIQRVAIALVPIAIGAALIDALIIIGIIVIIVLLASKYKEKQKAKEQEKTDEKDCSQEYKDSITDQYHKLCDAGNTCSEQIDNCATATAKVGRRQACVRMRTEFQQKCFNPGDPGYEEHMQQIANQNAGLLNCIRVMHVVCGDRKN